MLTVLLIGGGAGCGGRATTHHKPGTGHEQASGGAGTLLATEDEGGHRLRQVPAADAPQVHLALRPDTEDGWNLELEVQNFRFTPDSTGGAAVEGAGHVHLLLDGRKLARVYGPWFHLPSAQVPRGPHTLTARLYADDHTAWAVEGKPVQDQSSLTATAAPPHSEDHGHGEQPPAGRPITPTPSGTGPQGTQPAADCTLTLGISRGQVDPPLRRYECGRGGRITLRVTSDRADTLHVHGYDREVALSTGKATTLTFTADRVGLFDVETHRSALVLAQLLVR
ncbi:hypothetical protein [Streptomyces sp. NPDC006879]|uniref:hypothetical protein n=1 Tax=Streptomyces sp. NPDC006879 TaxID=3364767 RepID=UPI00369AB743